MNEYHFQSSAGVSTVICHCPACGGVAPESLRPTYFAALTLEEEERLVKLFAPFKTIQEVLHRFGAPTSDNPHGSGSGHAEKEGQPPSRERYRQITYRDLSETAEVLLRVHPDDRYQLTLFGKYLGGYTQNPG